MAAGVPALEFTPNILLIVTDQQRWDALGSVSPWLKTPNMDRLAAEGVRFGSAFTNSPVCVPARVSLALGLYPHNHGVWQNQRYTLPAGSPTWMRELREAGYRTSLFGKTHLHPLKGDLRDAAPLLDAYGFEHADEVAGPKASVRCRSNLTDLWRAAGVYDAYRTDLQERLSTKRWLVRPSPLPLDLYPDVYVGHQAAAHLRALGSDRPWFCWVGFPGPHEPWDTPEPYAGFYDPHAMPPARGRMRDRNRTRPSGFLDDRLARARTFDPADVAAMRADYAGNVTLIDDQIGALLEVIEARGELDTTVVALVSDHGELNGDYGLIYKQVFLDPAVKVPFLLRLPPRMSAPAGLVSDLPVELLDLGATLLEVGLGTDRAGRWSDRTFSTSLVSNVLGRSVSDTKPTVVSELRGEVMVATRDWKAALNTEGDVYLLIDLDKDPDETTNLAGSRRARGLEEEARAVALRRLVQTSGYRSADDGED